MTDTSARPSYSGYDGSALTIESATGRIGGSWIARDPDPRLDFPTPAELCRCCALELLASGSRWSVWFCRECLARVRSANERDADRIPVGRHSIANGLVLRALDDDEAIADYTQAWNRLAAAMDRTEEWTREQVRRNCAALGWPAGRAAALGEYLDALAGAEISREDAFREMLAWWAISQ